MAAHGRQGLAEALSGSLPLKVAAARAARPSSSCRGRCDCRRRSRDGGRESRLPGRVFAPLADTPAPRRPERARSRLAGGAGPRQGFRPCPAAPGRHAAQRRRGRRRRPRLRAHRAGPERRLARVRGRGRGALPGRPRRAAAREGLAADWEVLRGEAREAIVAAAEEGDLIALSTHRRLGLDASLDGCVAFGVARAWGGAMLIVPCPAPARASRPRGILALCGIRK